MIGRVDNILGQRFQKFVDKLPENWVSWLPKRIIFRV